MEGRGAEEVTVYMLVDVAAEERSDEVKNEEDGSKVYVVEAAVLGIKLEAEEDSTEVLGSADVGEVNTELSVGTTLLDSKIDVDNSGTLVDSEETGTDDTGILFDATEEASVETSETTVEDSTELWVTEEGSKITALLEVKAGIEEDPSVIIEEGSDDVMGITRPVDGSEVPEENDENTKLSVGERVPKNDDASVEDSIEETGLGLV
ncbi:hypothetical protein ACHAQE_006195 [Botrytis cinerea]